MLGSEYAVLAEAAVVCFDDLADPALMRRRVEHHDDQELGALAHDVSGRLARLALDVEHAQSAGKTRRDGIGQERGPFRLAHLAPRLLVAAEIKVDLERRFQRRRANGRRAGLGAGTEEERRKEDQLSQLRPRLGTSTVSSRAKRGTLARCRECPSLRSG